MSTVTLLGAPSKRPTHRTLYAKATTKFCQVYADAVGAGMPNEDAYRERSLCWHGERMPLAAAAELYANIVGYNEFKPTTIAGLGAALGDAFPGRSIEVTPAREYSVAVYLHIPESVLEAAQALILANGKFGADEVDIVAEFTSLQAGETELDGRALRLWWD